MVRGSGLFRHIEKLITMKLVSFVKPMALLAVLACFFAVGCGGETAPVAPETPAVVEDPAMEAAPAEAEAAPAEAEAAPAEAP
jgi:hypothetical protein